jgi:hypothetical protein
VAENAVFLGGDFAAPIERKVTEVEWEAWAYKVAEVTSVKRNFHEIFLKWPPTSVSAWRCWSRKMAVKNFQFQILYIHIFEKCKTLFFDMQSELRKYIFEI